MSSIEQSSDWDAEFVCRDAARLVRRRRWIFYLTFSLGVCDSCVGLAPAWYGFDSALPGVMIPILVFFAF